MEASASETIATTSVNVVVETPGPPYSFGTVIPQRPVWEKDSISSTGRRRSLSRAEDSPRICSANSRAASNACSSLLIRCASAISKFGFSYYQAFRANLEPITSNLKLSLFRRSRLFEQESAEDTE